ncbi:MAG: ATP-binding cassette domain-containing protein, partial [Oscillospiraceae bacterium]|nr:ATP-binding cassette domain-containing protein [Oscillospiraceae bacterium]
KGVPEAALEEGLSQIDSDEAEEKLYPLVLTKCKTLEGDPQIKLKLLKYALGRGYSYDQVAPAVEKRGLMDNLKLQTVYARNCEVRRIDKAQAADFIAEKADGYHSAISQGGTNVSGGQKQRLSIARAIARQPKIYIFDDSFSALDFKTDTALRRALSEKTRDAAVIIVAQRVSTILNADQIIVLEEGRMIGKGTHRELVKHCEEYRMIAQSQLSEAEFKKSIGKEEV